MKKYILSLAIVSLSYISQAQRLNFEWDATPHLHTLCDDSYAKESACMITEKVQYEFTYSLKGEPKLVRRMHQIVKVNDEKGIEMYNKIKINYNPEYPITSIKARSILPNGKTIELKPEAFKDLKDDDGSMNKIFAMEGIEKGAEIEYIVEMPQYISFFGGHIMQDQIPTCKSEFEIVSPENLLFDVKGYNNANKQNDSLMGEKNSYYVVSTNLIGLEEEKMASYLPHFARVEYALAYNTQTKGRGIRILTWDDAAKNIYKNYYSPTEKELKAVSKLIEGNKEYKKFNTELEKIIWIENFIKSNYQEQEYVPAENAESIEFTLKNKLTNETGTKILYAAIFISQKIPFEMGYTTNRFTKPFDYSFTNWENLKNCVFYFPSSQTYMAPNDPTLRIPFIPATWTANDAMFCKILQLGDVVTASATKRRIPEVPAELNYHNHDVDVVFNESMDTSIIQMKNTFAGYNALDFMPIFVYLEKEKRDDATKDIMQMSDKVERMDNFQYINNKFSSVTEKKPLIISATIHASNTLEKAGNKYLFHVGELIGRQSEMYQEKTRQFDIEIPNAHQYTRELKIHIPNGYKVNNLDKLNMNVIDNVNGKENCKFISSYTLNGDLLTVNIFEVYHNTFTPKSDIESYTKVINAAADFNKIVIVFEKK